MRTVFALILGFAAAVGAGYVIYTNYQASQEKNRLLDLHQAELTSFLGGMSVGPVKIMERVINQNVQPFNYGVLLCGEKTGENLLLMTTKEVFDKVNKGQLWKVSINYDTVTLDFIEKLQLDNCP